MVYDITQFGAVADGVTNCAAAIQAAVDAAAANGGGTVLLPPGRYVSGSVLLKSHVELHLEAGAVLMSSLREEAILPFPADPEIGEVDGWNGGFFLGASSTARATRYLRTPTWTAAFTSAPSGWRRSDPA